MNSKILLALVLLLLMTVTVSSQTVTSSTVDTVQGSATAGSTRNKATNVDKSDTLKPDFSRTWGIDIKGHGNSYLLTVIGMGVVFFALTALYLTFAAASRIIRNSIATKHSKMNPDKTAPKEKEEMSAEVNAAIAMALYEYFNADHDQENAILTINRVSRMYSPWSSKIYNLRHHPRNW